MEISEVFFLENFNSQKIVKNYFLAFGQSNDMCNS